MTRRTFYVAVLLLTLLATVAAGWNLGGPPVADLMEVRNLVTAREISETGRWLLPTMNGELRLAKPPLPTWAATVAGWPGAFANLWMLRAPTWAIAVLGALALVVYTRRLGAGDRASIAAGLILLTMFLYDRHARLATWDVPTHAFCMMAIAVIAEAYARRSVALACVAAVFVGATFMSKGPVSFAAMLAPWLLSAVVYKVPVLRGRWAITCVLAGVSMLLIAAWPLYVYVHEPAEAVTVMLRESEAWSSRHVRSVLAYAGFPVFAGAWLPLALAVLSSPVVFKSFFARRDVRATTLWLWAAFIVLAAVPTKKERYLLPVLFPLAALIALWGEHAARDTGVAVRRALRVHIWLAGLAGAAAFVVCGVLFGLGRAGLSESLCAAGLIGAGLAAMTLTMRSTRPLADRVFVATMVLAACVSAAGWHLQERLEPSKMPPLELRTVIPAAAPGTVTTYGGHGHALYLAWAAGRHVEAAPADTNVVRALAGQSDGVDVDWVSALPPESDEVLARLVTQGVRVVVHETRAAASASGQARAYWSRIRLVPPAIPAGGFSPGVRRP
jgi:4-amino-4-deoxy-L-arabinose transferase-like glycosyltransferase